MIKKSEEKKEKDSLRILSLEKTGLLAGMKAEKKNIICLELRTFERKYPRGNIIIMAGTEPKNIGIVLTGYGQIVREDAYGRRHILSELEPGDMFAEAYVAAEVDEIPISVEAVSDCEIMWIPYAAVFDVLTDKEIHDIIVRNMVKIIAHKNVIMNEKMRIISCRTTREKIMTYLMQVSEYSGSSRFKIPFDRNQLSEFLVVDRSAMSRELSRLRDEGYIAFRKNSFEILKRLGDSQESPE